MSEEKKLDDVVGPLPGTEPWNPDLEFLKFLSTIEQNSICFGGDMVLRMLMLKGIKGGREMYNNTYRDLKDRYELYKQIKDQPPQ